MLHRRPSAPMRLFPARGAGTQDENQLPQGGPKPPAKRAVAAVAVTRASCEIADASLFGRAKKPAK